MIDTYNAVELFFSYCIVVILKCVHHMIAVPLNYTSVNSNNNG